MNIKKEFTYLIVLFTVIELIAKISANWLMGQGLDPVVLMIGNFIVFILTIISLLLLKKGMNAKTTQGFLSSVYSSFLLKLVVAGSLVVLYVKLSQNVNNPAIFATLFIYLIYTFIEMRILLSSLKKN